MKTAPGKDERSRSDWATCKRRSTAVPAKGGRAPNWPVHGFTWLRGIRRDWMAFQLEEYVSRQPEPRTVPSCPLHTRPHPAVAAAQHATLVQDWPSWTRRPSWMRYRL